MFLFEFLTISSNFPTASNSTNQNLSYQIEKIFQIVVLKFIPFLDLIIFKFLEFPFVCFDSFSSMIHFHLITIQLLNLILKSKQEISHVLFKLKNLILKSKQEVSHVLFKLKGFKLLPNFAY